MASRVKPTLKLWNENENHFVETNYLFVRGLKFNKIGNYLKDRKSENKDSFCFSTCMP